MQHRLSPTKNLWNGPDFYSLCAALSHGVRTCLILQVFAKANLDCRKLVLRTRDAKSPFGCIVGSGKFLFDRHRAGLYARCRLLEFRWHLKAVVELFDRAEIVLN